MTATAQGLQAPARWGNRAKSSTASSPMTLACHAIVAKVLGPSMSPGTYVWLGRLEPSLFNLPGSEI